MTKVSIRPAVVSDTGPLPSMQVESGAVFRQLGMHLVADGPAPTAEGFTVAALADDLLVAELDGTVVGFVRTKPLDGCLHVEQVTVATAAQGHGIGRALMLAAEQNATDRGFNQMTLTSFRDVAFNGPFYRGLGWHELEHADLSPGLRAEREEESAAGIDRWPRVAMAKVLA